MIFLTGDHFLFKGCWWIPGSSRPSWSTWTSCKFHNMFIKCVPFVTVVAVVCFHQQGTVGQKGSKGSNVSPYSLELLLGTHCFIHFLFFFFFLVRVHKVRKETLDWLDSLDLRYVYQATAQTSLNTTQHYRPTGLSCSAFTLLFNICGNKFTT